MIQITGGKKEQVIRQWFNDVHNGLVPRGKVLDLHAQIVSHMPDADISYSSFNGVLKKIVTEGHIGQERLEPAAGPAVIHSVVPQEPLTLNVVTVEDMEFPNFKLYRTGKKIDDLFSDHEEGGGTYGGTVNIVIGESGVGKSTVMLDMIASIQEQQPDARVLYISSEMTRNDILFYYKKTPSIAKVPTLLLMDYVKSGQVTGIMEQAFNGDYDIIILDSYQDVLVKIKEVHHWTSTRAESWLTGLMIDSAETKGSAVFAIQHMTKGGTYVGSTYLKHATTAMLEIRFDLSGKRYVEFSKNRRGGSAVGKRLYYFLQEGQVVYDVDRFNETEEMREIENSEMTRRVDMGRRFEEIFKLGEDLQEGDSQPVEQPAVQEESATL